MLHFVQYNIVDGKGFPGRAPRWLDQARHGVEGGGLQSVGELCKPRELL